eukprot:CAMPEP_0181381354 /NCGR_PEP_ID=MMETSP1106-20121128/20076_1 /TAXON_ID=81844 /ORGANISM="Mantoniella antarctica, Strain SL-175" /LENGTH=162 /DNA_ID=CAMNT_0023500531 /DNA_START=37 /DNA_END=525 /DNA_ORIENTATION=-
MSTSSSSKLSRCGRRFLAAAALGVVLLAAGPLGAAAQDEPECPTVDLSDIGVIAAPCVDPAMACDLDVGCIGAIIGFIEGQLDLSTFTEVPSQDFFIGCIAPFALSPEVTNTIPQETLGGMITCDFDAITTRFEAFYAASAQNGSSGPSAAPSAAPAPSPVA